MISLSFSQRQNHLNRHWTFTFINRLSLLLRVTVTKSLALSYAATEADSPPGK